MSRVRIVVIVAVLLVAAVARATHHGGDGAAPVATATARPSASPTAPSASPAASASPSASVEPSQADSGPHEDIDPAAAAQAWVKAWLDTSGGKDAWLARLKPITEATLYAGLAQTDITRVPHATVQSGTGVKPVDGRADVTGEVPTSAGGVLVTMTVQGERWVATAVDWAPGAAGATA